MFALQVVGHSLGGALASLTATYVTSTSLFAGNDVRLVTFGQPRTGDLAYAKVVTSLVSQTHIYVVKTSLFPAQLSLSCCSQRRYRTASTADDRRRISLSQHIRSLVSERHDRWPAVQALHTTRRSILQQKCSG